MILQVGVKAVLRNTEGKILVLARSARYGVIEGSWDLPGGRIDPGSSLMDNLAREVREEAQLSILGEPRLIAAQDIFSKDGERHIVRLTYAAQTEGEPVLDGAEHTESRWMALDELRALPTIDEYLKALIDSGTLTDPA